MSLLLTANFRLDQETERQIKWHLPPPEGFTKGMTELNSLFRRLRDTGENNYEIYFTRQEDAFGVILA